MFKESRVRLAGIRLLAEIFLKEECYKNVVLPCLGSGRQNVNELSAMRNRDHEAVQGYEAYWDPVIRGNGRNR